MGAVVGQGKENSPTLYNPLIPWTCRLLPPALLPPPPHSSFAPFLPSFLSCSPAAISELPFPGHPLSLSCFQTPTASLCIWKWAVTFSSLWSKRLFLGEVVLTVLPCNSKAEHRAGREAERRYSRQTYMQGSWLCTQKGPEVSGGTQSSCGLWESKNRYISSLPRTALSWAKASCYKCSYRTCHWDDNQACLWRTGTAKPLSTLSRSPLPHLHPNPPHHQAVSYKAHTPCQTQNASEDLA